MRHHQRQRGLGPFLASHRQRQRRGMRGRGSGTRRHHTCAPNRVWPTRWGGVPQGTWRLFGLLVYIPPRVFYQGLPVCVCDDDYGNLGVKAQAQRKSGTSEEWPACERLQPPHH